MKAWSGDQAIRHVSNGLCCNSQDRRVLKVKNKKRDASQVWSKLNEGTSGRLRQRQYKM
jgi:hypothetical protein